MAGASLKMAYDSIEGEAVRFDHVQEYLDRFPDDTLPSLYMEHLDDEAFDALIVKAIAAGVPIDPEALAAESVWPGDII